jgi:hypothetical protein
MDLFGISALIGVGLDLGEFTVEMRAIYPWIGIVRSADQNGQGEGAPGMFFAVLDAHDRVVGGSLR